MSAVYVLVLLIGVAFCYSAFSSSPIQYRTLVQSIIFLALGAGGLLVGRREEAAHDTPHRPSHARGRRAARPQRAGGLAQPLPKGHLVVVGGGGMPEVILQARD